MTIHQKYLALQETQTVLGAPLAGKIAGADNPTVALTSG
jgi:hypothetical protein